MRNTKIICTIGPASEDEATLEALCRAGMNVARLNFSHGTHEEHLERIRRIRRVRERLNLPVAIMLDTRGPEYRIKTFENGRVTLKSGDEFTFTTRDIAGDEHGVSVALDNLTQSLAVGDTILVNNGLLSFKVKSLTDTDAVCEVEEGGELSNRKSMNFPGKVISQPYLSEQDRADIRFGVENDVDFIACSFVSRREDLLEALELLGKSPIHTVYIVDSYGSLYPEEIRDISDMYLEKMDKYGKQVGIHAHNNMQLAFANTITACANGVSMLDATMNGMGRGAGNCMMEQLMTFLRNPKYQLPPVLRFVEQHMDKLRAEGVKWGYDTPYLLTGYMDMHPRTAIAFTKDNRHDYATYFANLGHE